MNKIELLNASAIHELKFGSIFLNISVEAFNRLGFEFGDSVDLIFSSGYELHDVPYYNGFYAKAGETVLTGYPGIELICIGIYDGGDVWQIAGMQDGDTVSVYLSQKGRFIDIQKTFSLHYSDDIGDYPNATVFANYRSMCGGRLKPGRIYRSASPCHNVHCRAAIVDQFMKRDGVQFVINLADSADELSKYRSLADYHSPYFDSLERHGRVRMLDLTSNFRLPTFRKKVADSFTDMLKYEGPALVHCTEGKDRTGFIALLIEGLCGATYREMRYDYMKTYENYYRITEENRPDSYRAIIDLLLDTMLSWLAGSVGNLEDLNYEPFMTRYLLDGGMTEYNIQQLKTRLCND